MKPRSRIKNEEELRQYYLSLIRARNKSPAQSCQIAEKGYLATGEEGLSFQPSQQWSRIRDELGALSAPGAPDGQESYIDYENALWRRLQKLVTKAI